MMHLDERERIGRVVRKHWFVFAAQALLPILFFAVVFPLIQIGLVGSIFFPEEAALVPGSAVALALFLDALAALVTWLAIFILWTNWYLDYWIITDRRIIDINQLGLFNREVSSFRLDRIQDITVDVRGVIPHLLNYGDIHVQTAGEDHDFLISGVPNPEELKHFVYEAHTKALDRLIATPGGDPSGT
jgi:uncharacterized membrane protein YdbT with pleckstrin-like domain